jgi:hypothetical protein
MSDHSEQQIVILITNIKQEWLNNIYIGCNASSQLEVRQKKDF